MREPSSSHMGMTWSGAPGRVPPPVRRVLARGQVGDTLQIPDG
jgi:hypothetical protein